MPVCLTVCAPHRFCEIEDCATGVVAVPFPGSCSLSPAATSFLDSGGGGCYYCLLKESAMDKIDYSKLREHDATPLLEFEDQVKQKIQREIDAAKAEEEKAKKKKKKKKRDRD